MARRFAKVSEEEIVAINEAAFFYPSDLVNTKTTIPLRVGEERWIYTSTLRVSVYIHHYSPPLRGLLTINYGFPLNVFEGLFSYSAHGTSYSRRWCVISLSWSSLFGHHKECAT